MCAGAQNVSPAEGRRVSPADAAAFLRAKHERIVAANRQRWEQARADAGRIIAHIAAQYHPRRIYQWGSVLRPERFNEMSDIDIAVEGIDSAERWFALYGDAMKMTDFPLDLVQFERIEREYRAYIIEHGKVMYERDG